MSEKEKRIETSLTPELRAHISLNTTFLYVCERERARERAGVNARVRVRTCTGVDIHTLVTTRECLGFGFWVWG